MTIRILLSLLFIFLSACSKPGEKRVINAEKGKGDIVIGAVLPENTDDLFLEGFKLAIDDLNAKGGILGRTVKAIYRDDEFSYEKGRKIAKKFVNNPDVVAVVGHITSDVAVPVSQIYENKIVFISPCATSVRLTNHKFKYIFRNIATDKHYVEKLVDMAKRKNFNKVLTIFVNSFYGKGLAYLFNIKATEENIEVVADIPFNAHNVQGLKEFFLVYKRKLKKVEYDAIFIAATVPAAAIVIKSLRRLGVIVPIFGSEGLDTPELWEIAGEAAEGIIVCTTGQPPDATEVLRQFNKRFYDRYGKVSDTWAAQTYDAVNVLAYAMEKAGTSEPSKVAWSLHLVSKWEGVTGSHTFDEKGDVVDSSLFIKIVKNGKFEYFKDQ